MAKRLEFYFDCSSPWTYLAFTRVHDVAARTKTEIVWKPILVGGVFNAVNQDVYERRANPDPLKAAYYTKDLEDWAHFAGIHIGQPAVFPVNSVRAMRGALIALQDGKIVPYTRAVFEAYWGADKDISKDEVLTEICKSVGVDPQKFFAGIGDQAIKDQLKANTDEVMARGGFGSPSIFVDKTDMYFGNDRMPLIREALQRLKARAA